MLERKEIVSSSAKAQPISIVTVKSAVVKPLVDDRVVVMPGELDAAESNKLNPLVRNGIMNKYETLLNISSS